MEERLCPRSSRHSECIAVCWLEVVHKQLIDRECGAHDEIIRLLAKHIRKAPSLDATFISLVFTFLSNFVTMNEENQVLRSLGECFLLAGYTLQRGFHRAPPSYFSKNIWSKSTDISRNASPQLNGAKSCTQVRPSGCGCALIRRTHLIMVPSVLSHLILLCLNDGVPAQDSLFDWMYGRTPGLTFNISDII